jgi:hypothetical protein
LPSIEGLREIFAVHIRKHHALAAISKQEEEFLIGRMVGRGEWKIENEKKNAKKNVEECKICWSGADVAAWVTRAVCLALEGEDEEEKTKNVGGTESKEESNLLHIDYSHFLSAFEEIEQQKLLEKQQDRYDESVYVMRHSKK